MRKFDKLYFVILVAPFVLAAGGVYITSLMGIIYFIAMASWTINRIFAASKYLKAAGEPLFDWPIVLGWFIIFFSFMAGWLPDSPTACTATVIAGITIFARRKKLAKDSIARQEKMMFNFCVGLMVPLFIFALIFLFPEKRNTKKG